MSPHDSTPAGSNVAGITNSVGDPSHYAALLTGLDGPDFHYDWNPYNDGRPLTLTYSFMATLPDYLVGSDWDNGSFASMNEAQRQAVVAALNEYSQIINLSFVEISDAGGGGMLRLGSIYEAGANWAGKAYYPVTGANGYVDASGGDLMLNRAAESNSDMTPGSWGYMTVLHEIGHALGLKHPFESVTDNPLVLPESEDSKQFTIMSYTAQAKSVAWFPVEGGSYSSRYVAQAKPALYDIQALQSLYGANEEHALGDDTYAWTANPDREVDQYFYDTIWDAGGSDTLDASNQVRPNLLDLREGHFSSVGFIENPLSHLPAWLQAKFSVDSASPYYNPNNLYDGSNNVAISFGTAIENAKGGLANDTLIGNDLDNQLEGNTGNDSLEGGEGNDVLVGGIGDDRLQGGVGHDLAVFSGNSGDYFLTLGTEGLWVASPVGGDGQDLLNDVEKLYFAGDGHVVDPSNGLQPPSWSVYEDRVAEVYLAFLGRPADPGGLEYWANRLQQMGGDLTAIIDAYANAPEADTLYGGLTPEAKIEAIYGFLLARTPDTAGLAYYSGLLNTGQAELQDLSLRILDGAIHEDLILIDHKVAAGLYFTGEVARSGASYAGDTAAGLARELLAGMQTPEYGALNTVLAGADTLVSLLGTPSGPNLSSIAAAAIDPLFG